MGCSCGRLAEMERGCSGLWQVFWFLTYFVDPLFVAATSFISRDVATRPRHASRMALLLIIMSATLGVGLGLVSFATPVFATHLFTSDVAVTAMFMKVAPFMGAGQMLASIVLVAEGVLIGATPDPALKLTPSPTCVSFPLRGVWCASKRPSPSSVGPSRPPPPKPVSTISEPLWCLLVVVFAPTCPTLSEVLANTPPPPCRFVGACI